MYHLICLLSSYYFIRIACSLSLSLLPSSIWVTLEHFITHFNAPLQSLSSPLTPSTTEATPLLPTGTTWQHLASFYFLLALGLTGRAQATWRSWGLVKPHRATLDHWQCLPQVSLLDESLGCSIKEAAQTSQSDVLWVRKTTLSGRRWKRLI